VKTIRILALAVGLSLAATAALAQAPAVTAPRPVPAPSLPANVAPQGQPVVSVDLFKDEGMALFSAQWRIKEAKIVEIPAIANHMDGYDKTYDIAPHAGEAGFDDSSWPAMPAKVLGERRGGGKISFIWYRAAFAMPAKVGDLDVTGMRAVLTVVVDDYAEVWVNGEMPRKAGYVSPGSVQGFNMPNRVVLTTGVKPGEKEQVAIFGINGPISVAPANFLSFREAHIDFYRP